MQELSYRVRISERARRVRVTADAVGGVEVVVPSRVARRRRGAAERVAAEAVAELRPWIERRRAEAERARRVVAARAGTVPYLGADLLLIPGAHRAQATRWGDQLHVPEDPDLRRVALERFYRRAARAEIAPRLDAACATAGTPYTRLTIRGQRTRWASCSRAGAMSFNWRLLLAPEPVLDYVVWHEVCHLKVMDHSPRFWALVAQRSPDYRRYATWLRRHGATLVLEL